MITQGKHAKIKLYTKEIRISKTYKESVYAENEFFALNFLAEQGIMNLNPRKETLCTISMDWVANAKSPQLINEKENLYLAKNLALYLKNLHESSIKTYGLYITHEDIFADNLLICENYNILYFIDWGLSKKRLSVYADIASVALGVFNTKAEYYKLFLEEYFGGLNQINFFEIKKYLNDLSHECTKIRIENNFETDSLKIRLEKAQDMVDSFLSLK